MLRFRCRSAAHGNHRDKGRNEHVSSYRQWLKLSTISRPALFWVMIDEHPDSINDGFFINNPDASAWQDIPASYHNGACGFSFADGHSEIKKWQSNSSKYPVLYYYPSTRSFDAAGRNDFKWYLERTGYIDARTSLPQFGY